MNNKPNFDQNHYVSFDKIFTSILRFSKYFGKRLKSLTLFLLLLISLKPILTYLIYPVKDFRRVLVPGEADTYQRVLDGVEPLGYHINNIFIYENIVFIYSIILVIIFILILDKLKSKK